MAARSSASRTAGLRRLVARLSLGDRVALAVLVGVPVALVLPWSLAGHPIIPADDLAQNYPLRVLAGAAIGSGHLPTWDPFIWSGTPLLAGWNAGALYPGTWLFAVLPGVAAWTANLVAVQVVCATGMYVLLRSLGCRPFSSVVGALVFSETGFMSGQIVHIGLVQGTGYLPWTLVALDALASATTARGRIGAVLLLGVALALCVLAGEPRAISSEAIVLGIYLVALVVRGGRGKRIALLAGSGAGIVLGGGLSAVQWVPGLSFVSSSQRGLGAYAAFGAGSLDLKTLVHFLLVPFIVGGNGNFGLPLYRAGFNLPEESIGVGLLPLCAALVYLPVVCGRPIAALRERFTGLPARPGGTVRTPRDLGVWYVLGIVGLVLTMGEATPLGRLLVHIPLYGGERLQNRNAVIFDFALAVLAAYLVDDLTAPGACVPRAIRDAVSSPGAWEPLSSMLQRLLALVPLAGAVALVGLAYFHPRGLQHAFGIASPLFDFYDRLTPYLVVTVVLAVGIGALFLLGRRLSPRVRSMLLGSLAFVDVGVYVASASYATAPSAVLAGSTPVSRQLAALTGAGGRFAIYNPLVTFLPDWPGLVNSLGETDLNILRDIPSVQGYGSIVGGAYQDATSTHDFEDLNTAALESGLADALDLKVILTLPEYLDEAIPANGVIPVAGATPVSPSGTPVPSRHAPAVPILPSGPWTVAPTGVERWDLGAVTVVDRVTVVVNLRNGSRPQHVEVGLSRAGGPARLSGVAVNNGVATIKFPRATKADTVVVRNPSGSPAVIGAVVAVTKDPSEHLVLDGILQTALGSGQWSFGGMLGPFSVFVNHDRVAPAWLQPPGSTTPDTTDRAPGTVITATATATSEPMQVDAGQPSLLVRSETYQSGWTATLTPLQGGPSRTVSAERFGLFQAVQVPAGRFRVTWRYSPAALSVGLFVTGASLVGLLGLVGATIPARRRARRRIAASTGGSSTAGQSR